MNFLLLIGLFFTYSAWSYSANLKCSYIHDIQEKYLNQHISFANFDKKKKKTKAFKVQIAKIENRVKAQFIKSIDPEKIYFTQSDINNIKKQLKNIFKKIKAENCSDINRIYKLYYKRVSERVQFAHTYLNDKFTLEPGIKIVLDSRKRKRSQTLRQINNFHKKYIQYQMANAIIASDQETYKAQEDEAKTNILRSYSKLQKEVKSWSVYLSDEEKKKCYHKKKPNGDDFMICKPYKWYSFYLNSFAKGFDPHSGYLSKSAHEDFEINMKLSLEGIGASLSSRYGHTVIVRLIPGGSAARSGKLKPKDKILAVGPSAKKMVNIFDMHLRDIVNMIRGKKGTPVYLKVMRVYKKNKKKKRKIFTVRLIRDRVHLKDQAANVYYLDRTIDDKKYKVAVLSVPSFYGDGRSRGRSVTKDVKKLLAKVKRKKVSALVLDLSNNGGGALTEAVRVAGLFFAKGSVVRQLIKTKSGDRYLTLSDMDDRIVYSGPLVVLVNRISASASEIVSGTLQSYKRAVIVGGDHTFGKGSIQSVERLRMGLGSVRVTVGLYFVPNGFSTQLKGVASDIPFPSIFSNEEIGEKNLDYFLPGRKIPNFISQSAYKSKKGDSWKPVSKPLISFLKQKSSQRIKENTKFKEIQQDIMEITNKRQTGYATTIAEIFDQAKKDEKSAEEKEQQLEPKTIKKSAKDRKMKYIQRPDIEEAVNIAVDQMIWESQPQLSKVDRESL